MAKSFDILGSKEKSIAILEIRDENENVKELAESIMAENTHVKTVLKKLSGREGEHRLRKYQVVLGNEDTEILHKEHGYLLKLDPQKTYFSTRESTERQRIAKQVNPGETVMVMFAGVGPYAIAIAKSQSDVKKIIAIEINPDSVEYLKENVRINKLSHKIIPVLGDVRTSSEEWYGKCDHVVMPLPLESGQYVSIAAKVAKKGGIVHLYSIGNKKDGNVFSKAEKLIEKKMSELNLKYKVVDKRIVLPYAPGRYKVCIEFKIL